MGTTNQPAGRHFLVPKDVLVLRVLGLSFDYHDAAAALVIDGTVTAAAEEERFSRIKHDATFPKLAARYCLASAAISAKDLDYVIFYEKPIVKFDRVLTSLIGEYPYTLKSFLRAVPLWVKTRLWVETTISRELGVPRDRVLFGKHHLSHAASAYYASPFESAGILTLDGIGEWASGTVGWGNGSTISLDFEMRFPHSIGLFYSLMTSYLGFKVNDGEWKVMGLAPYGEPKYAERLRRLITIFDDGSVHLDTAYLGFLRSESRMFIPELMLSLLGVTSRKPADEIGPHHADIAASVQHLFEECLVKSISFVARKYDTHRLCYAGGAALNSVANGLILTATPIREVFIPPSAGDGGGAVGAALLAYNSLARDTQRVPLRDAFLGPEFDDGEIREVLHKHGIESTYLSDCQSLLQRTVELLHKGKIVGWFQGRMEFGPRALGARSILADPRIASMKDVINAKVKYRESFRPFAASVPEDDAGVFFEIQYSSPFMLMVCPVRKAWRDRLAAVTHVDGSCRVQTLERQYAPLYYDLLKEFGSATGIPVLLNTSFNIRGEPIVCSPDEALVCFLRTGLDALVIGQHLVQIKIDTNAYTFDEVDRLDIRTAASLD